MWLVVRTSLHGEDRSLGLLHKTLPVASASCEQDVCMELGGWTVSHTERPPPFPVSGTRPVKCMQCGSCKSQNRVLGSSPVMIA